VRTHRKIPITREKCLRRERRNRSRRGNVLANCSPPCGCRVGSGRAVGCSVVPVSRAFRTGSVLFARRATGIESIDLRRYVPQIPIRKASAPAVNHAVEAGTPPAPSLRTIVSPCTPRPTASRQNTTARKWTVHRGSLRNALIGGIPFYIIKTGNGPLVLAKHDRIASDIKAYSGCAGIVPENHGDQQGATEDESLLRGAGTERPKPKRREG
jgi:hypothetical protein